MPGGGAQLSPNDKLGRGLQNRTKSVTYYLNGPLDQCFSSKVPPPSAFETVFIVRLDKLDLVSFDYIWSLCKALGPFGPSSSEY